LEPSGEQPHPESFHVVRVLHRAAGRNAALSLPFGIACSSDRTGKLSCRENEKKQ
jgi:hypothetical protein